MKRGWLGFPASPFLVKYFISGGRVMINQQILSIRSRLLKVGWTQVDLVTQLLKDEKYKDKSRNSLQVQVNYLLKGKRFNKTSQELLESIEETLKGIEDGKITREFFF